MRTASRKQDESGALPSTPQSICALLIDNSRQTPGKLGQRWVLVPSKHENPCNAVTDVRPQPHPQVVHNRLYRRISQSCVHVYHCFQTFSSAWFWCARMWGEAVVPALFSASICPKASKQGHGRYQEVRRNQPGRAPGSRGAYQLLPLRSASLGAKDSIHSQASFCNVEGSENRKETSERVVRETTLAAGNSARTSRQDLLRPAPSLPTSLRPFTPSPLSSSLLHLEPNLISSSPTFSYSLHSTPCGAKIPKKRNRDVDEYRKAKGGGETANSGGRTGSETWVAGWRGVKLRLAFRVRFCTWRALASNVVASVLACNKVVQSHRLLAVTR